jgi:hypothetical protein
MLRVKRTANRNHLQSVLRWIRALVPAAVLMVDPGDVLEDRAPEGAITLDLDEVPSGPVSLADALIRAASANDAR